MLSDKQRMPACVLESPERVVGEDLGSYRVIAPLGKGGMASVYVGEHKVLGHRVAIKILHPKHLANESIERRFFNEARAIAAIKHPSIVELFDFGRADDGRAYIVMELLEGESLRGRIRQGIMDEGASAAFARQVASGLARAHERGIIHRDLKPDNIFLVTDPEVVLGERAKVLDFGIAKHNAFGGPVSEHTATGILVGTPAYMSPEQCRGTGTVDARSDIYGLGVVLYRMVTNQLPFEASGTGELIGKHLYVEPRPAKELNPVLSDRVDQVIARCLQKHPADRFQSMKEVAGALSRVHAEISARPASHTQSPLPAALAVSSPQEFSPVGASATPASSSHIRAAAPAAEEIATEIQVTPSQVEAPPLDEETSPTTLRTAAGETSRVDQQLVPLGRRVALLAAGAIAAVAVIAFAVSGGDQVEPGSDTAAERHTDDSDGARPATGDDTITGSEAPESAPANLAPAVDHDSVGTDDAEANDDGAVAAAVAAEEVEVEPTAPAEKQARKARRKERKKQAREAALARKEQRANEAREARTRTSREPESRGKKEREARAEKDKDATQRRMRSKEKDDEFRTRPVF